LLIAFTVHAVCTQEYQRELSLNTALNYELRQLKQQETSLLKLLLDHLATCPMPGTVLATLTTASKPDSHDPIDPSGPVISNIGVDPSQTL